MHLARHRLADLFLDTLPYNAHATGCDALCAGLPVLTRRGEAFAGAGGRQPADGGGIARADDESAWRNMKSSPWRWRAIRRG